MKVLVTGVTGCIGAATVKYLVERDATPIVGFSRHADPARIEAPLRERVEMVRGDIGESSDVHAVVKTHRPTHIIHLAAFQTPDCMAQPLRGMDINVGGTANVLKAAARVGGVERVVFASSGAVYGPRALYPSARVTTDGPLQPSNLYGYWKACGEGMAQAFHQETGVPAVSLRLMVTYGPGRDRGLTSAETTAIKAAALGVPFELPYIGTAHYHYVRDVASGFGEATLAPFQGYGVFNLRGTTHRVSGFLDTLKEVAREEGLAEQFQVRMNAAGQVLRFVWDLDDEETVRAFPGMTLTELKVGLTESLRYFRALVASGELTAADV